MTVNSGYIGGGIWSPFENRCVEWRCFYDATFLPVGSAQPIINGPNGFAFECDDIGTHFYVDVWRPNTSAWETIRTPSGAVNLRANQIDSWGIITRGDVNIQGPVLG